MPAATPAPAPLPPLDPNARYTVEEAIRYLRTSRATIYKWIASGELKTITAGDRHYRERCPSGKVSESRFKGRSIASRRWVPGSEIARLCAVPAESDAA